jgi:Uma2 family endonuclease
VRDKGILADSSVRERSLITFVLNDKGVYEAAKAFTHGDTVVCHVLQGLEISVDEIFADTVEEPEEDYGIEVRRV